MFGHHSVSVARIALQECSFAASTPAGSIVFSQTERAVRHPPSGHAMGSRRLALMLSFQCAAVQRTATRFRRLAQRHPVPADRSRSASASRSGHRLILGNYTPCDAYAVISSLGKTAAFSFINRSARSVASAPRAGPDRDNFRDNLGDSSVPATRSLAYT